MRIVFNLMRICPEFHAHEIFFDAHEIELLQARICIHALATFYGG